MAKVEPYSSLTKRQEDLFRLGYYYKSLACATLLTNAEKVTFKARAAQKADSSVLASSSIKVPFEALTVMSKARTDGLQQVTLEYAPHADLKFKGEYKKTQTSTEQIASIEYRQPTYALKLALSAPNVSLRCSTTIEKDGKGAGLDFKFDSVKERISNYNAALWLRDPKYALVLKHNGSNSSAFEFGEFALSYFHEASQKAKVAVLAKYNVPRRETAVEFGGDYKWSAGTVLRSKVNSAGLLSLGLTHELATGLKIGVASQLDMKKVRTNAAQDYKVGLRLDFAS